MDELPMMPGLMDGAADDLEDLPEEVHEDGEAGDLVALLNAMTPEEIADLQAEADESLMAGELDQLMSGADVADAEPGEVVMVDGEGGAPAVDGLDGGEDAGEPHAGQVATEAGAMVAEIGTIQQQLADLADAHEDSEADLDVDSAIAEVEDAMKTAEAALAEAEACADSGDYDGAVAAKKEVAAALDSAKAAHAAITEEAKAAAVELTAEPDPIQLWAEANA